MNLFYLFCLDVLDDHVEGQLVIDEVTVASLKPYALVECVFFVLPYTAMDVVDELVVDAVVLRQLLSDDLTVHSF